MLDQDREAAEEFIERFRIGEFDDYQLAEALDSLPPDTVEGSSARP